VWYDSVAVENFKANTPYYTICNLRPLQQRSGRTIQLFGYVPFGPSNAKAAEGLTGPSLPLSSVTNQIFLDQYVDYISYSDVAVATFIDPAVQNGAKELAYRGALTVNQVIISIVDAAVTIDAKVPIDLADNEFLNSSTIRRCEFSLDAMNAMRRAGGMYVGIGHPLAFYDLLQDNTAGSVTDVLKRTEGGADMLQSGSKGGYTVVDWAGIRLIRTTTAPTYNNFPSSGKTGYGTHVFGDEAFFASTLANGKLGQLPKDKNFTVTTSYFEQPTPDNAALQVAAAVSYNFLFGVAARPNTNSAMPYRRIRSEVSIV
jgi:N4-gp56 family major capsid protein